MSRPSVYSPEVADQILCLLAEGLSLSEICRRDGMPARSTVGLWVVNDVDGFSAKYARARELQVERWSDEIVEIADDGTNDWTTRQNGDDRVQVPDAEHMQRSRLRVDTRKWLMSKLVPHRYGDKQQVEHTGRDGGPIEMSVEDKRKEALARIGRVFGEADKPV